MGTSSVTGSTSWLMLSTPPFEPLACTRVCTRAEIHRFRRDPRWARNWPLTMGLILSSPDGFEPALPP